MEGTGTVGYSENKKKLGFRKETELENGAGEGNRTPVASLEGWSSAIELRPLSPNERAKYITFRGGKATRNRV